MKITNEKLNSWYNKRNFKNPEKFILCDIRNCKNLTDHKKRYRRNLCERCEEKLILA